MSRTLAITLARSGSKGVPGKNSRQLNGKPLISYTIEQVIKSTHIDEYLVFTNDSHITTIASQYGDLAPVTRSETNAQDTSSSTDALIEAVHAYEAFTGNTYDYIVECMATSPFKTSSDIDNCITLLKATSGDSVIAVTTLDDHHPARAKQIIDGKIVDFCGPELAFRRQDLEPKAYIRNGSIYALTREALLIKKLRFGGPNSYAYVMPPERSINIDTPLDFILAEAILAGNHKN